MIRLKQLICENLPNDGERFREPLSTYLKQMFREYDDKQLMMFGMSTNDLVDAFLNKILSIRIYYGYEQGGLPTGTYHGDPQYHHVPGKPHEGSHDYIEIEGIDPRKYNRSVQYQRYTDSVIYHELIHAVNFHKKLWDEVTYTSLDVPSEKYYSDPEEIRAYRSQIRDFLVGHLKLTRAQAEKMMAKYSTDQSKHRVAWMPRYYDLKEGVNRNLERIGEDPDESRPDMPVNWDAKDIQILDEWNPKTIREFLALPKTFQAIYPAILETSDLDPKFAEEEEEFGEWGGYEWDDFRRNKGGFPPIVVRRNIHGHILMVDGNHRVKWAQEVGYRTIAGWVVDELIQKDIESKNQLKELEYPIAGKDDLQSYGGMAGWKGKIVWMSPDKFLKLCHPLPERFRSPHSLARLRDRMKNKLPIDFLVLKVDSQKKKVVAHEGRHRATVAKELGIEKVPVLVYFEESYPRVPKWGPEHHDFADKAEFKPEYDKT